MVKRDFITQEDINLYNNIDTLTHDEIVGGDVDNEGIELSLDGSDLDEFPEVDTHQKTDETQTHTCEEGSRPSKEVEEVEPGELPFSEEDEDYLIPNQVVSKVKRIPKITNPRKYGHGTEKFSHLKNEPDFKQFLRDGQ